MSRVGKAAVAIPQGVDVTIAGASITVKGAKGSLVREIPSGVTVKKVETSIVVEREEKIKQFVPRDFWEVRAEFVCAGGVYEGRWLDTTFKKDETDPEKKAERLWSKAAAESIVAACRGKAMGFKGALCLRPDQVDGLNRGFGGAR